MERPQNGCLPTLNASVKTLTRELEQLYQTVKSTCGERPKPAPVISAVCMVIKGK
jgi:hypothetical protein